MTSHELAEELSKKFEFPILAMPTNSHSQLLPIANRLLCNIYRRVVFRPTTGDDDWFCITRSRHCNSDNGIGQAGVVPCCTADGMTSAVGKREENPRTWSCSSELTQVTDSPERQTTEWRRPLPESLYFYLVQADQQAGSHTQQQPPSFILINLVSPLSFGLPSLHKQGQCRMLCPCNHWGRHGNGK